MKELYKALASFQQEVPVIHKATEGYNYSYADLTSILKTINPLLKKHGLGFTQLIDGENLKTRVFHLDTAQVIESSALIPSNVKLKNMNDFQVFGSAITYFRRYMISSMLGLITDADIDACGEQLTELDPNDKELLDKTVGYFKKNGHLNGVEKKYFISEETRKLIEEKAKDNNESK